MSDLLGGFIEFVLRCLARLLDAIPQNRFDAMPRSDLRPLGRRSMTSLLIFPELASAFFR